MEHVQLALATIAASKKGIEQIENCIRGWTLYSLKHVIFLCGGGVQLCNVHEELLGPISTKGGPTKWVYLRRLLFVAGANHT